MDNDQQIQETNENKNPQEVNYQEEQNQANYIEDQNKENNQEDQNNEYEESKDQANINNASQKSNYVQSFQSGRRLVSNPNLSDVKNLEQVQKRVMVLAIKEEINRGRANMYKKQIDKLKNQYKDAQAINEYFSTQKNKEQKKIDDIQLYQKELRKRNLEENQKKKEKLFSIKLQKSQQIVQLRERNEALISERYQNIVEKNKQKKLEVRMSQAAGKDRIREWQEVKKSMILNESMMKSQVSTDDQKKIVNELNFLESIENGLNEKTQFSKVQAQQLNDDYQCLLMSSRTPEISKNDIQETLNYEKERKQQIKRIKKHLEINTKLTDNQIQNLKLTKMINIYGTHSAKSFKGHKNDFQF